MTPFGPNATGDQDRFWLQFRFGLGLGALFLSTVVVTLALLAVTATVIPRWHSTIVASGSMEPALRRGDTVVYVDKEIDEVDAPEIIVFDNESGIKTIHRIDEVNDDGTLTTRGDNNPDVDLSPVTADRLHGAGRVVVPWVGLVRLWWIDGRHGLVLAVILGLVLGLRATRLASGADSDPWAGQPRLTPATAIAMDTHDMDVLLRKRTLIAPERRRELISASSAAPT